MAALDVDPIRADRGDAELAAFFDECPTSYAQQTPAWRDVVTAIDRDEATYLGCRGAGGELVGVLPAYRFEGPLGAILTSVPQAGPLGGVACRAGTDPEPVYAALLAAYLELACSTDCALATVITNPLWPDADLCARHFAPDYVLENSCQVLDLEEAFDASGELVGGTRSLRRNVRKARSGALRIDEDQSEANVDQWYAIHAERHGEIGATPLPRALFLAALEHAVPRDKARFFFVRLADGDEMVAGGFYVRHGVVMDAFMPSLRSAFAHLAPNFLLAVHTMRWALERGVRFYNWQGSPPESGVYRFKQQWGSRDVPYAFLTKITGDAEPFLSASVAELSEAYRWHYALPYDRLGSSTDASRRRSSRVSAWEALAASER